MDTELLKQVEFLAGVAISSALVYSAVFLAAPIINLMKVKSQMKKDTKRYYSFQKGQLETEIARLERGEPGRSIYDCPEYMEIVLREYGGICREATAGSIPPEEARIMERNFCRNIEPEQKD